MSPTRSALSTTRSARGDARAHDALRFGKKIFWKKNQKRALATAVALATASVALAALAVGREA